MKKLQLLTASAGILLALAGPSLAASRVHRGTDAYASGAATADRSGSYYYGPRDAQGHAINIPFEARAQYGSGGYNEPYADRPYGDPDSW